MQSGLKTLKYEGAGSEKKVLKIKGVGLSIVVIHFHPGVHCYCQCHSADLVITYTIPVLRLVWTVLQVIKTELKSMEKKISNVFSVFFYMYD